MKLFPHQVEGIEFLSSKKCAILGDDMGLGKTIQAIRGLDRIHARKILIICPAVARINWQREIEEWSQIPRQIKIFYELSDTECGPEISICSFDYAAHNFEHLKKNDWDALIVDEAHFLKTPKAKRTQNIMGTKGIVRASKRVWLLTGTPAPNHAGELWVPLFTFGVTKLSYDDFIKRYCDYRITPHGIQITGTKHKTIPEIRQLLSKVMLRRKKDLVDLPPINFRHRIVEAGPVDYEVQSSFMEYFIPVDNRKLLFNKIEEERKLVNSILKLPTEDTFFTETHQLLAIQNISNKLGTLRKEIGLKKVQAAIQIVRDYLDQENQKNRKIVLFCMHRDVIKSLRDALAEDYGAVTLYGKTPPEKRQSHIDAFQNKKSCRVFIAQIQAAGTAITLTASNHIIFVEQSYVPGENAQATMRCHRIGQKNRVLVDFLLLDDPIDTKLGKILRRKTAALTQMFD